jgi:hypothetical protein
MYDPDTYTGTDEPDWSPPPPQPDGWRRWQTRVAQVAILQVIGGLPLLLALLRLAKPATVGWMLGSAGPMLLFSWLAAIAYFWTLAGERDGSVSERGRMLVLLLDVLTAVFLVVGLAFWISVLTRA